MIPGRRAEHRRPVDRAVLLQRLARPRSGEHLAEMLRLRCPFHGWTWKLDGTLLHILQEWDLPHVDQTAMTLPEARVGTWGGYVFVNFDLNCEPLTSYLENLPEHFAAFDLGSRPPTSTRLLRRLQHPVRRVARCPPREPNDKCAGRSEPVHEGNSPGADHRRDASRRPVLRRQTHRGGRR
jgi:hypothetical protein